MREREEGESPDLEKWWVQPRHRESLTSDPSPDIHRGLYVRARAVNKSELRVTLGGGL